MTRKYFWRSSSRTHDDFGEEVRTHNWGVDEKHIYAASQPSLMQMRNGSFEFWNFLEIFLKSMDDYNQKKFGGIIKFSSGVWR